MCNILINKAIKENVCVAKMFVLEPNNFSAKEDCMVFDSLLSGIVLYTLISYTVAGLQDLRL